MKRWIATVLMGLSVLVPACTVQAYTYPGQAVAGNFARTVISQSLVLTNATTVTVAAIDKFPTLSTTNEYFYLVLIRAADLRQEIVKVTSVATNKTLTIVRAQDGTSPLLFKQNDRVELWVTAGLLDDRRSEVRGYAAELAVSNAADTAALRLEHRTDQSNEVARLSGVVTTGALNVAAFATNNFTTNSSGKIELKTGGTPLTALTNVAPLMVLGNLSGSTGAVTAVKVSTNLVLSYDADELVTAEATKEYANSLFGSFSVLYPSVQQVCFTGTNYYYNHASSAEATEGINATSSAFWIVEDVLGNTALLTNSPATTGTKIKVAYTLHFDSDTDGTGPACKLQRSIDGGLSWTNIACGAVTTNEVAVTTVGGYAQTDHQLNSQSITYIDSPAVTSNVIYRILVTMLTNYKSSFNQEFGETAPKWRPTSVFSTEVLYSP